MQRTGHALAVDDSLGQRAATVWTAVLKSEHLVMGITENGDIALPGLDNPCSEFRDIFDGAYFNPLLHN